MKKCDEITSLTSSYFKEVDEIECAILKIEVKALTKFSIETKLLINFSLLKQCESTIVPMN